MTFTATYSETYIEYTVTFVDEDGTVISTKTYHYGDEIEAPASPAKASDETYDYAFAGWDKEVAAVGGNATYRATYSRAYIEYTVTFVDEDGTVISTKTYHYGDEIEAPASPAKASDETYDYAFAGWDKEVGLCSGNTTFTATYSKEYTESYKSAVLRDELLSEIEDIGNVDLLTYFKISAIQEKMSGLTDADRSLVEAELNKIIDKYNNFVATINSEYEESAKIFDSWIFGGAVVASFSVLSLIGFALRRRFML